MAGGVERRAPFRPAGVLLAVRSARPTVQPVRFTRPDDDAGRTAGVLPGVPGSVPLPRQMARPHSMACAPAWMGRRDRPAGRANLRGRQGLLGPAVRHDSDGPGEHGAGRHHHLAHHARECDPAARIHRPLCRIPPVARCSGLDPDCLELDSGRLAVPVPLPSIRLRDRSGYNRRRFSSLRSCPWC